MSPGWWIWMICNTASAAPNHAAMARVVGAAEKVAGEALDATLIDGLLAPGVGVLPETCAAGLRQGRAATDTSERAMEYANALRDLCPPTCASDTFATLANHPASEQLPILIAACDAKGPDPVFGTPELRAARLQMDGIDYLLTRMVLDPVFLATSGTPLGARYAALRPALAAAMTHRARVEIGAPTVGGGIRLVDAQFQVFGSQTALERCYAKARETDPTLTGEVEVVALIDAVGRTLADVDGAMPDDLMRCVEQVAREQWVFSAPPGDDPGKVSVRIGFRPG